MDAGDIHEFWRQHQNIIDAYASVWCPVSEWKPLTILVYISKIYSQMSPKEFVRAWDVNCLFTFPGYVKNLAYLLEGWIQQSPNLHYEY